MNLLKRLIILVIATVSLFFGWMLLVTPNETSPLILRVVVSLVFLGFGLVSIRFLLGTNEQVEKFIGEIFKGL